MIPDTVLPGKWRAHSRIFFYLDFSCKHQILHTKGTVWPSQTAVCSNYLTNFINKSYDSTYHFDNSEKGQGPEKDRKEGGIDTGKLSPREISDDITPNPVSPKKNTTLLRACSPYFTIKIVLRADF